MFEIKFLTGHTPDLQNIATFFYELIYRMINNISFFLPIKFKESLSSTIKNVSTKNIGNIY